MRLRLGLDQLFFYLVCFVMLMTLILGVVDVVRASINILLPIPEAAEGRPFEPKPGTPETIQSKLPPDVIAKELQAQESFNKTQLTKNDFNSSMLQILRGLAQMFIALPVYLYHWRKIALLDM